MRAASALLGLAVWVALGCAGPRPSPTGGASADGSLRLVVAGVGGLYPLFAEEERALQTLAAELATREARGRWTVVALAESEALAQAAEGARHPTKGHSCAVPTPPFLILDWAYPDAGELAVDAHCEESCALTVIARGPKAGPHGRREELARWSAPVGSPALPSQWLDAARALKPAARPEPRGGMDLFGGGTAERPAHRVRVKDLRPHGPWAAAPTTAPFDRVQDALDVCWQPPASGLVPQFNLEVDPEGQVERCERRSRHGSAPNGDEPCLCQALQRAVFTPGAPGRRLQVTVHRAFEEPPRVNGRALHASIAHIASQDPFAVWEGARSLHGLAACFAAEPPRAGRLELPVTWSVQENGRVVGALAQSQELSKDAKHCLIAKLMTARFPCPLDGEAAEVTGTLRVYLAPP